MEQIEQNVINMSNIYASPIFAGIDPSDLSAMLKCLNGKRREYKKGEYLLRVGERIDSVGLLCEGRLLIVQEDFLGNRNIMAQVEPGSLFAEAFAYAPDAPSNFSVYAESDAVVIYLEVGRLMKTCTNACSFHSRMIRNMLTELAVKNLAFNEKLTHMSKRTTRAKLLSYLSSQAERQASPDFYIPFNRQQLADYLSVERSAMSSELSKLRDEGYLDFDKNHFVLKMDSLQEK